LHTPGSRSPSFGNILRYSLGRIWYPLWLVPIAVVAILLPLHMHGTLELAKAISEPIEPGILASAFIIAGIRWHKLRRPFFIWLALLLAAFFYRELHFAGTATMMYIAFLVLMFAAWLQYPKLGDYLGSRLFLTLFSTTLFSYMIAVGLDKHWWKFLPGHKYQWARVEEYVEIAGHLLLLALTITVKPVENRLLSNASQD